MYTTDTSLFKMLTLLFDAAPGKYYYDAFAPLADRLGIDFVARELGSKQDLLATALGATADEQARNLVTRLGLDPDAGVGTSDDFAYNFFKGSLEQGNNAGSLVMAAIRYLEQDGLPDGLAEAGRYLSNRAEASRAISTEMGFESRDLPTLQSLIEKVGLEPDSVQVATRSVFDKLRQDSVLQSFTDSDDEITGTEGADYIDGGPGYDTINGLGGADILIGGSGDDTINGGRGQDLIEGGDGADTLYAGSYYSPSYIRGGYNSAGEYVSGYNLYDVDAWYEIIRGGGGSDKIYGGYGSDYLTGDDGADVIYGDEESFYYSSDDRFYTDQLARMYNDTILGGAGNDVLYGNQGNDHIEGGEGSDTIYGGTGNDTLYGGAGDDKIFGSDGADTIEGGDGNDVIEVGYADGAVDTVSGGAGNDTIKELRGNDVADGGDGDDKLFYSRGDNGASSVLIAGEGADWVYVSDHSDRVTDRVIVDFTETVQSRDELALTIPERVSSLVEVKGFDIETDVIEFSHYYYGFDTYRSSESDTYNNKAYAMQSFSWGGDLTANYVQIVDSASTPWLTRNDNRETPDDYGKAFFVIQGAVAASASTTDVAALLDAYGNNATYANSAEHVFLVDIDGVGLGIYKFADDTGADNRVVSDELTPLIALVGVSTDDITYANADFIVS